MNKQEKMIAMLLGLLLAGWMFFGQRQAARQAQERGLLAGDEPAAAVAGEAALVEAPAPAAAGQATGQAAASRASRVTPDEPEEQVELRNGDWSVVFSSHGAGLRQVTLEAYTERPGRLGENNPAVRLDFSAEPAFEVTGLPGLAPNAAYRVEREPSGKAARFFVETAPGLSLERRVELCEDYQVRVTDTLRNGGGTVLALEGVSVGAGTMVRGASKNEILSIDSLPAGPKAAARHWDKEKEAKGLISGGGGFGCGGARPAAGLADETALTVEQPQAWVAIKSRFFVAGLTSSEPNLGFAATFARDTAQPVYALKRISARLLFPERLLAPGETHAREYTLFVGPKKLALLQRLENGMDAVMQFGTFTWFCKLLVPTLNFFHRLIPNYGIAIILLTFLVRILFWPLTHKSTQSMKKMQEIQPKLKEIQAKFKDQPQKMQQETWAVYRENKVNPMSSCLPMLVQIPVFIALFTVLRSAVELRYAPFLWIADLSEPENLLAGVLPIPLNILPILMSATMAVQSYLTPSAGDPAQQRMMMVMMPVMMLFMFYSFPAALSLYWTVSQVLSIVQMLMMRRKAAHPAAGAGGSPPAPLTRQQRRLAARLKT